MATHRVPSLLEGADAGLFVEPPPEAGRSAFTLYVSPDGRDLAAGDRLAHNTESRVADILEPPSSRKGTEVQRLSSGLGEANRLEQAEGVPSARHGRWTASAASIATK